MTVIDGLEGEEGRDKRGNLDEICKGSWLGLAMALKFPPPQLGLGAQLSGAQLSGAQMSGAQLSGAQFALNRETDTEKGIRSKEKKSVARG